MSGKLDGTTRVCRVGTASGSMEAMPPPGRRRDHGALAALPGWAPRGRRDRQDVRLRLVPAARSRSSCGSASSPSRPTTIPTSTSAGSSVRVALTTHSAKRPDQPTTSISRPRSKGSGLDVPLVDRDRRHRRCCSASCCSRSRTRTGPSAPDVAIGYERAWDELNFGLLWDLSRPGAPRRPAARSVHRGEAPAYAQRGSTAGSPSASRSTRSSRGHQTALVVTRVTRRGRERPQRRIARATRANGWTVVGYSLRPAGAADATPVRRT